ncbi:ATPase synthesis protein 25, mitochondrial [Neonectria ditissima]|uniref:ATPase synthesis protein 25 n=1 Tax=Neonectria ditissima TaxID=78410 RepID=A0A0N8H582_9HYPO|nr:ATPase synthesis protein 25, mitochondrial [Neonectria ditissima]
MLARPAAAALACRQCQSAVFRAIVSRPALGGFRSLPLRQSRQLPILTQRFFTQERTTEPAKEEDSDIEITSEEDLLNETSVDSTKSAEPRGVPWFLEVDPPRHPPSQHEVELPKIPEHAPDVVTPMLKYIFEDMGLDEISLLDLRDLDPPAALGPNLIMLFGTTRSERHLHISSGRLVRWLKRNYKIDARADGLIGPGELRTKLRRLRKKAKLMGTNTAIVPGGDNGISTGWVCVNFSSNSGNSNEVESFDDSGRFSGFGASPTGTTIVIQCMTEARRNELSLEPLWQGILKRSLQKSRKIRGEKAMDDAELDALVAARVQIPASLAHSVVSPSRPPANPSELQWQALKQASKQHRYYSTTARRLLPSLEKSEARWVAQPRGSAEAEGSAAAAGPDLEQMRKLVGDIQLAGIPFNQEMLQNVIRDILKSPSAVENAAAERLSLVDQLLLTAEERGMSIWNNDMFVTLVESAVTSPSYGPELQRAQKNIEYLINQKACNFDHDQILRLMTAYASRQDWTRFWDTFRMPSRFKRAREHGLYNFVYRVMAATKDQKMCIEALRWVYPEMVSQDPPVIAVGSLYDSLKACILIADPAAEELLHNVPDEFPSILEERRLLNREFLKLLREVEATREQASSLGPAQMIQQLRHQ